MTVRTDRTAVKSERVITLGVALWSMIALAASGYLGTLVLAPDLVSGLVPKFGQTAQSDETAQKIASISQEVSQLSESVQRTHADAVSTKEEMTAAAARSDALTARVASLEQKIAVEKEIAQSSVDSSIAPATPSPAPPRQPVAVKPPAKSPAAQKAAKAVAVRTSPTSDARAINVPSRKIVETGSVGAKTAPVEFGPAIVTPAERPTGVIISSGDSVDALRLSWSLLSERNSTELKNLDPRYVQAGEGPLPSYDLLAGPISSPAEAQKICQSLKAKNVTCRVSDFGGNAL